MTAAPETLPELSERNAPPSVRAVYAGLREAAVAPIAALIWRHIATYPGMLEACWASLKPAFESGQLPSIAWRIAKQTTPEGLLPRIEPHAQVALGITSDDAATIRAVVEAYNRANPVNLLAVLTLLARLESNAQSRPSSAPAHTPLEAITRALPRMTPPGEMSPNVRWLLNDLRLGDRTHLDPVVPSLYRHLTNWPAYLGTLHIALAPRFRDGSMSDAIGRVEKAMAAEAAVLGSQIEPIQELQHKAELQATMRRFTSGFIPMMIVVGCAMAEQLPEGS